MLAFLITCGIVVYTIGQIISGTTAIRKQHYIYLIRTNTLWGARRKVEVEGKAAQLVGITELVSGFITVCLLIMRVTGMIESWGELITVTFLSVLFFGLLGQYFSVRYSENFE